MAWHNSGNWSGITCADTNFKSILADLCRAVNERREVLGDTPVAFYGGAAYPNASAFIGATLASMGTVLDLLLDEISNLALGLSFQASATFPTEQWVDASGNVLSAGDFNVPASIGRAQDSAVLIAMKDALDMMKRVKLTTGYGGIGAKDSVYQAKQATTTGDEETVWDSAVAASPSDEAVGGFASVPPALYYPRDDSRSCAYVANDLYPFEIRSTDYEIDLSAFGGGVVDSYSLDVIQWVSHDMSGTLYYDPGDGSTNELPSTASVTTEFITGSGWPAIGANTTYTFKWSSLPASTPVDGVTRVAALLEEAQVFIDISGELTDQS